MVVTLIGLVIVASAAIYIAWPLLAGVADDDHAAPSEATALEKEKEAALDAIREIDFDLRVGKISDEDHASLRADLEQRALQALSALDEGSAPTPDLHAVAGQGTGEGSGELAGFCSACGHPFKAEARFCMSCGQKLPKPTSNRKKRRSGS